ncbi:hypothetical protein [Nocardiopsis suaedae]|uniref:DUF4333 domain-containing protein n=1 Tax=Nocardiopsis suaedae TaxID=3018444 RepID=A0ABT4TKW5_9ACTN|nr:hypothetical protein [Nocardiopsis suaedae]MDA2805333.1 hypothetical protein [Nocardiopsis suaedae]
MLAEAVRTPRLALVPAAAVLALTACAGGAEEPGPAPSTEQAAAAEEESSGPSGAEPPGELEQGEVPEEQPGLDEADLPDEPADDAPLGDRIAFEALEKISSFAQAADPGAGYACPDIAGEEGESATCTVTYMGEEFDYSVDIESSGFIVQYQQDMPEGPVVREAVQDQLRYSTGAEKVLCDMEDVVRAEPEAEVEDATCFYEDGGGEIRQTGVSVGTYGVPEFDDV